MFKVCGIFGISKIEFLNFSGTERVKRNVLDIIFKNLKTESSQTSGHGIGSPSIN